MLASLESPKRRRHGRSHKLIVVRQVKVQRQTHLSSIRLTRVQCNLLPISLYTPRLVQLSRLSISTPRFRARLQTISRHLSFLLASELLEDQVRRASMISTSTHPPLHWTRHSITTLGTKISSRTLRIHLLILPSYRSLPPSTPPLPILSVTTYPLSSPKLKINFPHTILRLTNTQLLIHSRPTLVTQTRISTLLTIQTFRSTHSKTPSLPILSTTLVPRTLRNLEIRFLYTSFQRPPFKYTKLLQQFRMRAFLRDEVTGVLIPTRHLPTNYNSLLDSPRTLAPYLLVIGVNSVLHQLRNTLEWYFSNDCRRYRVEL